MLAVCLACSLSVGCQENLQESQDSRNLDAELVNTLNNLEVNNALIAQHTLYPYHFVTDGEVLNELGVRDLSVLAHHFAQHEGILNVRRGATAPELYEARVTHVLEALKNSGVDTGRMAIKDGMPGGDGMPSERVVTIMEKAAEADGPRPAVSYTGETSR
jgi:hypothetical protein